jgi:hypothetical protein
MSNLDYMLGNLMGRVIMLSLFVYIIWIVYTNTNTIMNTPPVVFSQEGRRFGRSTGRGRRFGRR